MKKFILLLIVCIAAFLPNANAQSPAFYEQSEIQEIAITFPQQNWRYLLDSLRVNGDGMLLGTVVVNDQTFKNAGVRFRGSKSFQPGGKRNGLNIKLNYINKNQNYDGVKTIKLSNALRDPSMVREVLSYDIARKYMPAPEAGYAQIKINGDNYGLYVNVEPIDDAFLTKHYGSADGALFKVNSKAGEKAPAGCKQKLYGALEYEENVQCYLHNFELLSEEGWDDLIEMTRILNEEPKNISKVLNVDRTLWMLAFNNVLANLSSYSGKNSQNFYLYKAPNGKFTPILWDMNLSFGSLKNTGVGSDKTFEEMVKLDPLLHMDNEAKPLISKLLANPSYKKVYLSHIATILADSFRNDYYSNNAKSLQRIIQVPFINDESKFYTFNDYNKSLTNTIGKRSKIPGIMELMEPRTDFLKAHKSIGVVPPEFEYVKELGRKQFSDKEVNAFRIVAKVGKFPKTVKIMYRTSSDQPYQMATMMDDAKNYDGQANDGTYGIEIKAEGETPSLEYYIMAENAAIMGYYPENYMWQPETVTLEELNQ